MEKGEMQQAFMVDKLRRLTRGDVVVRLRNVKVRFGDLEDHHQGIFIGKPKTKNCHVSAVCQELDDVNL